MKELLRSNDLVYLSWVQATLAAEGMDCLVLDEYMSGAEANIGALPRRVMIDDDLLDHAVLILEKAQAELNGD